MMKNLKEKKKKIEQQKQSSIRNFAKRYVQLVKLITTRVLFLQGQLNRPMGFSVTGEYLEIVP